MRNETFPPGKAGRSATIPALQSDLSILDPEITARRGCNPGLQSGCGHGCSCRAFVGREWLRNETFPPGKAGRSATIPALQSDLSILDPEITARRGCNPGLQSGCGHGCSCRAFVGREWLRNETFPPRKAGRSATIPALQPKPESVFWGPGHPKTKASGCYATSDNEVFGVRGNQEVRSSSSARSW